MEVKLASFGQAVGAVCTGSIWRRKRETQKVEKKPAVKLIFGKEDKWFF
jgi:hypothetical protein